MAAGTAEPSGDNEGGQRRGTRGKEVISTHPVRHSFFFYLSLLTCHLFLSIYSNISLASKRETTTCTPITHHHDVATHHHNAPCTITTCDITIATTHPAYTTTDTTHATTTTTTTITSPTSHQRTSRLPPPLPRFQTPPSRLPPLPPSPANASRSASASPTTSTTFLGRPPRDLHDVHPPSYVSWGCMYTTHHLRHHQVHCL